MKIAYRMYPLPKGTVYSEDDIQTIEDVIKLFDYCQILEALTTVVATVDDTGLPVTAAIDMMDTDGDSMFFLTAKGKGFYDRLIKRQFMAFTAMKGEDTMSSVAVSVRGKVRELGYDKIPELFDKNPYMHEIYPTEEAMKALTVFQKAWRSAASLRACSVFRIKGLRRLQSVRWKNGRLIIPA